MLRVILPGNQKSVSRAARCIGAAPEVTPGWGWRWGRRDVCQPGSVVGTRQERTRLAGGGRISVFTEPFPGSRLCSAWSPEQERGIPTEHNGESENYPQRIRRAELETQYSAVEPKFLRVHDVLCI